MHHLCGTVLVLAMTGLPAAIMAQPLLRPSQGPSHVMDDERMGTGPGYFRKCFVDRSAWYVIAHDTCEGYPRTNLLPLANARRSEVATWAAGLRWERHITPIRIPTTTGGAKLVTVRAIKNPKDMPIDQLRTRGLVVLHIVADPTADPDSVLGIGGESTKALSPNFYVVVDPSDSIPKQSESDSNARPLRRWHLFGVDQAGQLVKVHSRGRLNWCGGTHAPAFRNLGSANLNCEKASRLTAALLDPAVSQKVKEIGFEAWFRYNSRSSLDLVGVWLTCGTGCCTADLES
jgi:hypothetical protein